MTHALRTQRLALALVATVACVACTSQSADPKPAPTLDAENVPLRGSMSWTQDGRSYSASAVDGQLSWDDSDRSLSFDAKGSSVAGSSTDQVRLFVVNISGQGTYGLGVSQQRHQFNYYSSAYYLRSVNGQQTFAFSATGIPPQAMGSLQVQAFDPAARTLAGTFFFADDSRSNGPAVSSGTFALSY